MSDSLFTKDIRGDNQNVIFARPDQYATPKYRPAGRGFLVGLSRDHRLSNPAERTRRVLNNGVDSAQRSRYQPLLSNVPNSEERVLSPSIGDVTDGVRSQLNYISITSDGTRKRKRLSEDANSENENESSTSSESKDDAPSNNDAENAYCRFRDDPTQARQRTLRDQISKDIDNFDAWFALANLQQDLVNEQNGEVPGRNSRGRLVSNLRIAIFEEGLSKVQKPASRFRLVEALLKEGARAWDDDKHASEWQRLLKNDRSFEIWKLYINYVQSKILNFSMDKVIEAYRAAFESVGKNVNGQERDEQWIYLVLRLTLFLKQAGFTERAIGIWQALLEINYCRPASVAHVDAAAALEEFWDGEVARIGEPNAKGWSGQLHEKERAQDQPAPSIGGVDNITSWCEAEQAASFRNALPARTFDVTDENDPYRIVLFQDIEQFLFMTVSEASKSVLLSAFLCFAGLPTLTAETDLLRWSKDPLLCTTEQLFPGTLPFTAATDAVLLFDQAGSTSRMLDMLYQSDNYCWTFRTLQLIALTQPSNAGLGELCIALEARRDPASARKLARKLVKQSPDSCRLYNTYALLEAKCGNLDTAEKVWATSLTSRDQQGLSLDPGNACLWHSWIWSYILRHDEPGACNVLAKLDQSGLLKPQQSPTIGNKASHLSPASYQAVRRCLESALDQARSTHNVNAMVLLFDLLALLEYLSNDLDLPSALASYTSSLPLLSILLQGNIDSQSLAYAVEVLHQYRARLIDSHVRKKGGRFKPQTVLEVLQDSATTFPNNSILLAMSHLYRQRYGLIDRLRGTLVTDWSSSTLAQHMNSIHSEMQRPEYAGGTEHSIRAAFLRAEDDDSPTRACPAIRLQHAKWEINLLEKKLQAQSTNPRKKDKAIDRASANALSALHSALGACPWLKELYMTALSSPTMRTELGSGGTRALYNAMLDRGIRVRVDISDLLDSQYLE